MVAGAALRVAEVACVGQRLIGPLADDERRFIGDRALADNRFRNERLVPVVDLDHHDGGAGEGLDPVAGRADLGQEVVAGAIAFGAIMRGDVPLAVAALPADIEAVGGAGRSGVPLDAGQDAGIVIDGSGIGSAIAANKVAGVRAAMAATTTVARYSREHNGANVLTLGATLLGDAEAREIVSTWLATPMREPRYIRRLAKIRDLEHRAFGGGKA